MIWERLRTAQAESDAEEVRKCPFPFVLIPGVAVSLEGPLRSRLVSRLWVAADWLPWQIGWISLPAPPLSSLGGACPRAFLQSIHCSIIVHQFRIIQDGGIDVYGVVGIHLGMTALCRSELSCS